MMNGNDFRLYQGMDFSDFLAHYGVGHEQGGHSGRYAFGSGKNPKQRIIKESQSPRKERKAARDILSARDDALVDVLVRGGQQQKIDYKSLKRRVHYYLRHPEDSGNVIDKALAKALAAVGRKRVSDAYKSAYDEMFAIYKIDDEITLRSPEDHPDHDYLEPLYIKAKNNRNTTDFKVRNSKSGLRNTKAYSIHKEIARLEKELNRYNDKMNSEGITYAEEQKYIQKENKIRELESELKRIAD